MASTLVPLFGQLKAFPRTQELSIPSLRKPVNAKSTTSSGTKQLRVWESSHAGFLSWGLSKAVRDTTEAEPEVDGGDSPAGHIEAEIPSELLTQMRGEVQHDTGAFQRKDPDDVVMGE